MYGCISICDGQEVKHLVGLKIWNAQLPLLPHVHNCNIPHGVGFEILRMFTTVRTETRRQTIYKVERIWPHDAEMRVLIHGYKLS